MNKRYITAEAMKHKGKTYIKRAYQTERND